jgi:hypothetical protein
VVKIAAAGNTDNPAILAIHTKGYRLSTYSYELHPGENIPRIDIIAEKDGNKFIAENGPTLLGLIAMWEIRGDDWQCSEDERLILRNELKHVAL